MEFRNYMLYQVSQNGISKLYVVYFTLSHLIKLETLFCFIVYIQY